MKNERVSNAVVRRLPQYYRCLQELQRLGVSRISSRELSERLDFNASQIRQDFNCFGGFGQQGFGYSVDSLKGEIGRILGLDRAYNAVLMGVGHIGQALLHYPHFKSDGFIFRAAFDANIEIIGTNLAGVPVYSIEELEQYLENHPTDIGIIATPDNVAQRIADSLSEGGVSAILNFAYTKLAVPQSVSVENVHMSDSLFVLAYRLNNDENTQREEERI